MVRGQLRREENGTKKKEERRKKYREAYMEDTQDRDVYMLHFL